MIYGNYNPQVRSISFLISATVAPSACLRDANSASPAQVTHVDAWVRNLDISFDCDAPCFALEVRFFGICIFFFFAMVIFLLSE